MKPYARKDRVGNQLKEELAIIISRQISDPRIKNATIVSVRMTADLKLARVYYRVPGDNKKREEAKQAFKKARGFLKKEVASRLSLRYMPHLEFYHDEVIDNAEKIEQILKNLPPPPEDE